MNDMNTPQNIQPELKKQYDFIICGAGSSGSVVAGRLAANPDVCVLLLEAGGSDETELVLDTDKWPMNLGNELDWGFLTKPNPNLNGRALLYSMGKVLGRGSSINVGTWSRGHKADWDMYAVEAGDSGWGYEAVLDIYRSRVENWIGVPDPEFYGTGGPMHVQPVADPDDFSLAVLSGAVSTGLKHFRNSGGRMMQAIGGSAVVDNIIHWREIGNSPTLRPYRKAELAPGNLTGTALEQYIRNGLTTFWHQSGTAKMGRDALSVVDGKVKVYGIEGLRIADASILPRVTTGNTMAPCVIVGERAASLLQEEHGV